MNSQEQLTALAKEIVDQDVCPGLRVQATQLVMADGNPDADIVIIGEAPGKEEDEQGLPFVGDAGKKLNVLLEASKLVRAEDVYITNTVKYRPPKNRDPSPTEKAEFLPYLVRELEIVNPKLIVTLGRHSMKHFISDGAIDAIHGQLHRVTFGGRDVAVLPLHHPSSTIYSKERRAALAADFAKIPEIMRQL